jgi:hypothetical protein
MYTPTITTSDYTHYLADNFGIAKKTLAAPPNGFEGLKPVLGLWKASRDISYFLLIIAFVFIGLGVMLRVKIDPRTVMTIQNQIPRVIIAIILITFSYAIAAIMIDLMWATTYALSNTITNVSNPEVKECDGSARPLTGSITNNILASPFAFVNRVFLVDDCDKTENGIFDLSKNVANNFVGLIEQVLMGLFGIDPDSTCTGTWYNPSTWGDLGDCFFNSVFGTGVRWLASIAWMLIIFITLVVTLFRIWFELLKAYAFILVEVIVAPFYIVFNLLPKRPLGFGRWIRGFFVNLIIFPVTVANLVLARVFMEIFSNSPRDVFVPPLIGNPNVDSFGVIAALMFILICPTWINVLKKAMSVEPNKDISAGLATFNTGRQFGKRAVEGGVKGLTRRNQMTGVAEAPLSRIADRIKMGAAQGLGFGKYAQRMRNRRDFGEYATDDERSEREARRNQRNPQPSPPQPPGRSGGPAPVPATVGAPTAPSGRGSALGGTGSQGGSAPSGGTGGRGGQGGPGGAGTPGAPGAQGQPGRPGGSGSPYQSGAGRPTSTSSATEPVPTAPPTAGSGTTLPPLDVRMPPPTTPKRPPPGSSETA